MVIEINKDIDRYQETVALGLTARQLLFSVASVVVGGVRQVETMRTMLTQSLSLIHI